jgi:hypothetical protein
MFMSGFRKLAIRTAAAVGAGAMALAVGALPAAQASVRAPAVKVPSACKTFTAKSADSLFGVKKGTHLTEKSKHTGSGKSETFTCTVSHSGKKLIVDTSMSFGGFGGPIKCYTRKALGINGRVCVSTARSVKFSLAIFTKKKIVFVDSFNRTLPHQGRALYNFALAQHKAFKG